MIHLHATIMGVIMVLSLVYMAAPLRRGIIDYLRIIKGLVTMAMAEASLEFVRSMATDEEKAAEARRAATAVPIDWMGTVLPTVAIIAVGIALGIAVAKLITRGRRRVHAKSMEIAMGRLKRDPSYVARTRAPHLQEGVDQAMARIGALRDAAGGSTDQETIDALALADGRLPDLMTRYVDACAGATEEEVRTLADRALTSVIEIGRHADLVRAAHVARRTGDLESHARYISKRTSPELDR